MTTCLNRITRTALAIAAVSAAAPAARADVATGFLAQVQRHHTLTSTVPDNGDQNPYAVVVAQATIGKLAAGDVLVDNFNDKNNLQGLGTTIVDFRPSTNSLVLFASFPRDQPGCPGGVGLTTAMTVLKSGWVIVGSLPSKDGMTGTKGQGCLLVTDAEGKLAEVISSPNINGPWGNMAVIDKGDSATLFVSNTGFGVGAPGQDVVHKATVLRLDLAIATGKPPVVTKETVIGDGFAEQADKDVFIIGPTGLALATDGTLYVSDALANRIAAIPDAPTRTSSAGVGKTVTTGGLMQRPLAMAMTPEGHLIATNGLNGQVIEIDPVTGKQIGAQWVDPNKAQTPPGSGDLFGVALTPDGKGFYYVEDEVNTLVLAH